MNKLQSQDSLAFYKETNASPPNKLVYFLIYSTKNETMKKLCVMGFIICTTVATSFAQDAGKIMVGLGGGILAPACTNCTSLSGFDLFAGYQMTNKIVATLDLGFYSKSDGSAAINSMAIGVSGDYYLKEAYKGFYVGPDVSYLTYTEKISGTEVFSKNSITIGLNVGWGIAVADNWRIKPHFGYGTWFENTKGRITAGLQVGYILK
jgi:hypothetical protein